MPVINNQVVTFLICQKTLVILLLNQSGFSVTFSNNLWNFFIFKDSVIFLTDRKTRSSHKSERQTFNFVGNFNRHICAVFRKNIRQNFIDLLFSLWVIIVRIIFWQNFIEEYATKGSITNLSLSKHANWRLKSNLASVICHFSFINTSKRFAIFLSFTVLIVCQVVVSINNILVNRENRLSVSRFQ